MPAGGAGELDGFVLETRRRVRQAWAGSGKVAVGPEGTKTWKTRRGHVTGAGLLAVAMLI